MNGGIEREGKGVKKFRAKRERERERGARI